jgi:phospholipid transport system substrate-binding protein
MRATRFISAITGFLLIPMAFSLAADTDAGADVAKSVVDKVIHDALAILQDSKLSHDQKHDKVRQIADDNADAEVMSRLSLGRNWRNLTDPQKKEFIEEFKKFIAATYGHTLDEYTDETVNITAARTESNGDVTVLSQVMGTKDSGARGEVAKVEYRLRKNGDAWKIIDFNIDGVSLISNFRSQFQDIISNGSFDQLLKLLKEKNAAAAEKK